MGGFFGAISKNDCVLDVFFGVDYHSHLGTHYAGMTVFDKSIGFQRQLHNVENTPFRAKFEKDIISFRGTSAIGCISETDPEPLLIRSHLGVFAVSITGSINNSDELLKMFESDHNKRQFTTMSSGKVNSAELTAALINEKSTFSDGIRYAQEMIEGSASILIMTEHSIIISRDIKGRLPVFIGKRSDGYCVSFESYVPQKLGYNLYRELGSGEIVEITENAVEILRHSDSEMKICAFLWTYYGYPNSTYEGKNVEVERYDNGALLARDEINEGTLPDVDFIAGMPDSGVPHAIGYANMCKKPFARPFIKYTPTWLRSFTPDDQTDRNKIAKMKQIPIPELINGKKMLFVDDSIVRGTQLHSTVQFLYENGAKEVHMRSACPPIMYSCKYLRPASQENDMELITRKTILELEGASGLAHIDEYADKNTKRGKCMLKKICENMGFDSLGYQSLDSFIEAIGIDKNKICTYCWTGKE